MFKKLPLFMFLGFTACVIESHFVDIHPNSEPGYFQMKSGEAMRFELKGFKRGQPESVPERISEPVHWDYSKLILEKTSADSVSITLRAKRQGISRLNGRTVIKGIPQERTIKIMVVP